MSRGVGVAVPHVAGGPEHPCGRLVPMVIGAGRVGPVADVDVAVVAKRDGGDLLLPVRREVVVGPGGALEDVHVAGSAVLALLDHLAHIGYVAALGDRVHNAGGVGGPPCRWVARIGGRWARRKKIVGSRRFPKNSDVRSW